MMFRLARWSFLILTATLPLVRLMEFRVANYGLQLTDLVFVLCALLWLAALIKGETIIRTERFFIFVSIYGAVLAASVLVSADPARSLIKLAGEFYLFGLCFLAYQFLSDRKFIDSFLKAWLTGTVLTLAGALFGIVLFYLGNRTQADNPFLYHFGSLPPGDYPRIQSFFNNANMMVNYLNVSLMLALVAGERLLIGRKAKIILGTLIGATSLTALSPGVGGLILSGGLWLRRKLFLNQKNTAAIIVMFAALVLATVALGSALVSFDTPNSGAEFTAFGKTLEPSVRVTVWGSAIGSVAEHPLLGAGVGTDPFVVRYQTLSGETQLLRDAHNIPLNVAGQAGLLGLAAFGAMVMYLVLIIRKSAGSSTLGIGVSIAFMGAFLYQGLTGSFEDARHIWILIGLLVAANQDESSADTETV